MQLAQESKIAEFFDFIGNQDVLKMVEVITGNAPTEKEEFRAYMHNLVDVLVDTMQPESKPSRLALTDKEVLDAVFITRDGNDAEVDRVLSKPDSRGVKYMGVVYKDGIIKQVAWDSEFKQYSHREGLQGYDIVDVVDLIDVTDATDEEE